MARVTVEDCIDKISNRFELVMMAAHRAREISAGANIEVERDNDKNPVIALREIAEEKITPETIWQSAIESYQTQIEVDEPDEDHIDNLMEQENNTPGDDIEEEDLLRKLMMAQGD